MIKYILLGIYVGLTIPAVLMMFAGFAKGMVKDDSDKSENDNSEDE